MAKFDFNNSKYVKFWESRDAQNALTLFLNTPDLFEQNYTFWKTQFNTDSFTQPRDNSGVASYRSVIKKRGEVNMLDMRSPLGDADQREKPGLEAYTGSIPDFIAKGYVETAMEREAKERMFDEYFGNDAAILSAFADDVQVMLDEGNQTMSNMAAQLLSTGRINYNFGDGIKSLINVTPIPETNYVKALKKAWADPDCEIITEMRDIEEKFRQDHGLEHASLKWQMPRDIFYNVFLKNKQVIEYFKNWCFVNQKPWADSIAPTLELYQQVFANNDFFSPIEVIVEKQKDGSRGYVRGWDNDVVVLRPSGAAGSVKRASLLDYTMWKKYGSSAIAKVFAQTDIFTIVNTTLNNGMYKEWHTDLMVSAVPALEEFTDHLIVDITEAES